MRADTNQIELLQAILSRLRSELSLDANQCFLATDPSSPVQIPRGGDYFLTLAPGQSVFEAGEQAPPNVTEIWSVWVTIYSRTCLDRTDEEHYALLDQSRGLYELKRRVLKALVGWDLVVGTDYCLRQQLYARQSTGPRVLQKLQDPRAMLAAIAIEFAVEFDWDLQG